MDHQIKNQQFKIISKIALSPGKVVYRAMKAEDDHSIYAIKSFDLDERRANLDVTSPNFFGQHPNILAHNCSFLMPYNFLWAVQPYISGGSVQSILYSGGFPNGFKESLIAEILNQTLDALCHLHNHERKFFHRNLKSGNILLDANGVVKITDFGAYEEDEDPSLYPFGDIWCLGVIAMELALGRFPLFLSKPKKKKFSKDFTDFVSSCFNEERRPSADNLKNHPFLKDCKGPESLKSLLKKSSGVGKPFKQSGVIKEDGLTGASIRRWKFNEEEFELLSFTATQKQPIAVVAERLRLGFAGLCMSSLGQVEQGRISVGKVTLYGMNRFRKILDEQRSLLSVLIDAKNPRNGLSSIGILMGDTAEVCVYADKGDLLVDRMIRLMGDLDTQRATVMKLIEMSEGMVSEDDVFVQVTEKLSVKLEMEKQKNGALGLELDEFTILIFGEDKKNHNVALEEVLDSW